MTATRFAMGVFLLTSFFAFSNNNTKSFAVVFPRGSSFVSTEIKKQAVKVYNAIPEQQYATVVMKGEGEEQYSRKIKFNLARVRTKNLRKFFIAAGLKNNTVKESYSTVTNLLIFKPKGKLKTSARLSASELEKHKEQYSVNVEGQARIVSEDNAVIVLEAHSFESESGTVVRKGEIQITLMHISSLPEIWNTGIIGNSGKSPLSPIAFIKIEAYRNGEKLKLRSNKKITVYQPTSVLNTQVFQGEIRDGAIHWFLKGGIGVYKVNMSAEEYSNFTNSTVRFEKPLVFSKFEISSLDWVVLSKVVSSSGKRSLKVKLKSKDDYAIYMRLRDSGLLIPAYKNTSYFNRYEFLKIPNSIQYEIVALPISSSNKRFGYQEVFEIDSDFTVLETSFCHELNVTDCIPFK